jgi:Flp pilus assembly pilin Flp
MFGQLALRCYLSIQGLIERAQDEEGQTLAEYGLILSVVAVAVVVSAAVAFRGAIMTSFASATKCLSGSC